MLINARKMVRAGEGGPWKGQPMSTPQERRELLAGLGVAPDPIPPPLEDRSEIRDQLEALRGISYTEWKRLVSVSDRSKFTAGEWRLLISLSPYVRKDQNGFFVRKVDAHGRPIWLDDPGYGYSPEDLDEAYRLEREMERRRRREGLIKAAVPLAGLSYLLQRKNGGPGLFEAPKVDGNLERRRH